MRNVLEFLENSARKFPDKIVLEDPDNRCSYKELQNNSKQIGSALSKHQLPRSPVIVFMDKSIEAVTAFMGIIYAGCFYVFINPDQPIVRIKQILSVLNAECIITNSKHLQILTEINFSGDILDYQEIVKTEINHDKLLQIRESSLDIDPLYCNFTSGSTGVPKGVLICHRSVIDFMEYFPLTFNITENDVIGNQAPFDFDVSVKDIYSTLKVGATMVIIPKKYFSIISELLDYLYEKKVTTLIWAVSALCIITQLKGFTYKVPEFVNKILFSGEIMPIKHLKIWQQYLPNALYANLYGPTEITCNCTYYIIDHDFDLDEKIPIGKPFPNEKVFLLDKNNEQITDDDTVGELCVSGTALALGYYNNSEQTDRAFVQNPINLKYLEKIYRTGDLAYYHNGNLFFAGRKDFQIKYMGHRIELEEIESVLNSYPEISRACCLYDESNSKIIAFYVGDISKIELKKQMQKTLPSYMIPRVFNSVRELPITSNGKIDRKKLFAFYGGNKND